MAVCCTNRTEYTNTLCGQDWDVLVVSIAVVLLAKRLEKLKACTIYCKHL